MKTTLEVGKKYRIELWANDQYAKVIAIHKDRCWIEVFRHNGNSYNDVLSVNHPWIPYIEEAKPVEWKTFLIEAMDVNVPARFIVQYWSLDAAKEDNKTAITIIEIKLNFEIV